MLPCLAREDWDFMEAPTAASTQTSLQNGSLRLIKCFAINLCWTTCDLTYQARMAKTKRKKIKEL